MDIKTILVPIDFSLAANNALIYATKLAKQYGASITCIHVHHVPTGGDATFFVDEDMMQNAEKRIAAIFEETKSSIAETINTPIDFKILLGFVADEIANYVFEHQPDVCILGTKEKSNKLDMLLGDNAYEIIKRVNCPVLAVPTIMETQDIKTIAFATDFKDLENSNSLSTLRNFAEKLGAEVHIICINNGAMFSSVEIETEAILTLAKQLKGIKHSYKFLKDDNIEHGITEYVKTYGISLLAMVPKKHNFLELLFRGSHTQKIIHHTKIPLLTFHD